MKKLAFLFFAFCATTAFAQDSMFNVGANVGLPMGDIEDAFTLQVGVDAAYLFEVGEGFYAGGTLGYTHFLAEDAESESVTVGGVTIETDAAAGEDAGFIPVAASAMYMFGDSGFYGAADLGYAIAISPDEAEGGIMYLPKVGYNFGGFMLDLGYRGIEVDGGSFSSIQLGVRYGF